MCTDMIHYPPHQFRGRLFLDNNELIPLGTY